jgi:hypothetical protein
MHIKAIKKTNNGIKNFKNEALITEKPFEYQVLSKRLDAYN